MKETERGLKYLKQEHEARKTCCFCGRQDDLTFQVDVYHASGAYGANIRIQTCEECRVALDKVNTHRDAEELQEIVIEAAINFLAPRVAKKRVEIDKRQNEIAAARTKKEQEKEQEGKQG